MSADRFEPSGRPARNVDFDATPLLDAPMGVVREFAAEVGEPGSSNGIFMSKLLRVVACGLMAECSRIGRGTEPLPAGLTISQASLRATELLDLADELDGLSPAGSCGGK